MERFSGAQESRVQALSCAPSIAAGQSVVCGSTAAFPVPRGFVKRRLALADLNQIVSRTWGG